MSQVVITKRILDTLKPSIKPYFLRDSSLKGFGVKVNPSGSVKYVAEIRHEGRTSRKTLVEYPVLEIQQAKTKALTFISQVKSGESKAGETRKVARGTHS